MCIFISNRTANILFWGAIIIINLLLMSNGMNRGYDYYEPQIEQEQQEP